MTTTKASICFALPALLCGALLGYFVHPAVPESEPEQASPTAVRHPRKTTDDAELGRLRARIKSLERQLADATATAGEAPTEEPAGDAAKPDERRQNPFLRNGPPHMPTAAEMRAHMEELREKDPERYAQMTNRFARWQEHRLQRTNDRLDILAAVDTSRLTAKELQTHEALQDAIVRREELRALLNPQNEDVTEEQRKKTFEELRALDQKMRQLENAERNTLLTKTARSYGLSKANAKEMTEAVKAIYQATGSDGNRHGFGGRGGPGGPPPGGPR